MKTTIKPDKLGYSKYYLHDLGGDEDIENAAELLALIHEAQDQLLPCIHCGHTRPAINYYYRPGDTYPYKALPDGNVLIKEHPHEIYAKCCRRSIYEPSSVQGCGIRTTEWHAEDDDVDFKEALRLTVEVWNRRPN